MIFKWCKCNNFRHVGKRMANVHNFTKFRQQTAGSDSLKTVWSRYSFLNMWDLHIFSSMRLSSFDMIFVQVFLNQPTWLYRNYNVCSQVNYTIRSISNRKWNGRSWYIKPNNMTISNNYLFLLYQETDPKVNMIKNLFMTK